MKKRVVDVVVLAGSRPGGDPLADAHGVPVKALVPVAGQPMLARLIRSLLDSPVIDQIVVMAQDTAVFANDPGTGWIGTEPRVTLATSASTIAQSLDPLLQREETRFPQLITTADNILLSQPMIDHFTRAADGSDIAIAVVERAVLMHSYPSSRRTWLKFRGGQYSGANLFYFGSRRARALLSYWAAVEQDRKKGWKILTIFGPWLLLLAVTRILTIHQLAARVGKKLGLEIRIVEMPQAEACIDVDRPSDLEMAEHVLASRETNRQR